MSQNIIGIDISDSSIEAIALDKKGRSFVVEAYSRYRLSPDIVEDGRVVNPDKLQETLVTLFKNAHPQAMTAKKVILSLPESRIYTKIISVPKNLDDKEMQTAIRSQAEEFIPESFDDLVLIHHVLPEKNGSKEILLMAARRDVIRNFVRVFQKIDKEVALITSEAVAS